MEETPETAQEAPTAAAPRQKNEAEPTGPAVTPPFCAGQRAPAGLYRQMDGGGRLVRLSRPDYLPASLDGRVAWYERVRCWGEALSEPLQNQRK